MRVSRSALLALAARCAVPNSKSKPVSTENKAGIRSIPRIPSEAWRCAPVDRLGPLAVDPPNKLDLLGRQHRRERRAEPLAAAEHHVALGATRQGLPRNSDRLNRRDEPEERHRRLIGLEQHRLVVGTQRTTHLGVVEP
jgi:hypothetical protein